MKKVGRQSTAPELAVRRAAFSLGYRFRLHDPRLPGSPDIVFASRRAVIFVHGCFWHGHNCRRGRPPTSNTGYWLPKLERNATRDRQVVAELQALGWSVLTIWECQVQDTAALKARLSAFLH
ncbi:very short patch repair endonuclease [Burkholderia vietnamiensis]|nr:very short patch repair endonuclease [Burkholderia vietnamiensis]MCO1349985.1 very short patch repair endonuclease [Burkholderia vietnamiensis]UQN48123.1 very short patch repair endonuclease [Burkholderia vietnamiensis]